MWRPNGVEGLTNALEPASDNQLTLAFLPALAHEALAVSNIKRKQRFTVVIGNPPYANFGQLNKIPFILNLLEDYKRGLGERKINLDDDFIKFIRFSQWNIERVGVGVVGIITSNTFLEGITHRQMRKSLADTFSAIRICDLHGNSRKKEAAPSGDPDENVFDIQQGVAITTLVRREDAPARVVVSYQELWGLREKKYNALLHGGANTLQLKIVHLQNPNWFFLPKDFSCLDEYEQYLSIDKVFLRFSSGVQTKRDSLTIQHSTEDLAEIQRDFALLPIESIRAKYELPEDGRDWTIQGAKADLANNNPRVIDIMYRPFDVRKTLWTGKTKGFLGYPRAETMTQMLLPNLGMNLKRQMHDLNWSYASVTRNVVESAVHFSTPSNPHFFPLYNYDNFDNFDESRLFESKNITNRCRYHNLTSGLVKVLSNATQFRFVEEGRGDLERTIGPEDVFAYSYAVFHSPTYRTRYAELLKIDFPRLPIPRTGKLCRALAKLGGEIIALHLMESPKLNKLITEFIRLGDPKVEKVSWCKNTVWLDKAQNAGFNGVREEVWNFHIGGYQVCEKWLKDRKGRVLTDDDIAHYQRIVVALSETIRLMAEIDEVIEAHGGWPGAFVTGE